jgi:hypothetical protein
MEEFHGFRLNSDSCADTFIHNNLRIANIFAFFVSDVKGIDLAVGLDQAQLTCLAGLADAVLHAEDAVKALGVDVLENIQIVDLPGGGFPATRVVADLKVGDLVPGPINIGDEIAFGNLLVIKVVQDFARGAADRLAERIGLGDVLQEAPGVVHVVEWFEHHDDPVGLEDGGAEPQALNHILKLITILKAGVFQRRYYGRPLGMDALGCLHGGQAGPFEMFANRRGIAVALGGIQAVARQNGSTKTKSGYKNPHGHAEFIQLAADAFLLLHRSTHHPIVLDGFKTMVLHEVQNLNRVLARTVFEVTEAGGIFKLERSSRARWRRIGKSSGCA